MILHSEHFMDHAFIAKAMKEHKLDPKPQPGFHSHPWYWQETEHRLRVMERYSWGAVLYLQDRTRDVSASILAVGVVDLDKGCVIDGKGVQEQLPVPWYAELDAALKQEQQKSRQKFEMPSCLGYHEADQVCDGGLNPVLGKAEPACAWRSWCVPFQSWAVKNKKTPEEALKGKPPEDIVQMVEHIKVRAESNDWSLGQFGKDLQPTPKPPASSAKQPSVTKPSSKVVKKLPEKRKGKASQKISTKVQEKIDALRPHFKEQLRLIAEGARLMVYQSREDAVPGHLFLMDRIDTSRYVSLYLQCSEDKKDVKAICSWRFKTMQRCFDIQVPLPADSPLLRSFQPQDVVRWVDGSFKSAIKNVEPEGAKVDLVRWVALEVIKGAVE